MLCPLWDWIFFTIKTTKVPPPPLPATPRHPIKWNVRALIFGNNDFFFLQNELWTQRECQPHWNTTLQGRPPLLPWRTRWDIGQILEKKAHKMRIFTIIWRIRFILYLICSLVLSHELLVHMLIPHRTALHVIFFPMTPCIYWWAVMKFYGIQNGLYNLIRKMCCPPKS